MRPRGQWGRCCGEPLPEGSAKGDTRAGDKLVGLLQLLFKALDGDERRITISGPGELQAALTSVSAVLGFKADVSLPAPTVDATPPESETNEP